MIGLLRPRTLAGPIRRASRAAVAGNPVSDPARDVCAGLVRSCKKRFGETNPLPYGGFPAAGLLRT